MACRNYILVCVVAMQWFLFHPAVHAQSAKADELFPFAIGTEWTYDYTSRDKQGRVSEKRVESSKVIGVHMFGDERWYCLNEFDMAIWSRNSGKGEEEAEVSLDEETRLLKKDTAYLFFKYPVKQGETWKTRDLPDDPLKQSMRLQDVGVKLKVAAGTFDCYLYELMEDGKVVMRFHVSPGVGIIKYEDVQVDSDSGETETRELSKYVIGKG